MKGVDLAVRWLITTSRLANITNKTLALRIFEELVASAKNESLTVKKRKEHHLLAYENKTYIRFLRFLK